MRSIRNFFHNISDIFMAIVIVAVAAGIIYWRFEIILDYPEQLAEQQAVYQQEAVGEPDSEEADAGEADGEKEDEKQTEGDKAETRDEAAEGTDAEASGENTAG